jgi:hypothetical protein
MFSALELARSDKGTIALRPQYLALILILVAPGPSRSQEAAASDLKGPVHSVRTEDFGDENGGSDKPLGSLYEICDVQAYVIKASAEGFVSQAYSREQRYRVIVWPAGPEGTPKPDRYDMNIEGRSISYTHEADGGYVIPEIPPGHYRLVSVAWSGAEYLGEGDTRFDVTDADVTLHLTLGGLGEIQGVVKSDDAQARVPTGVMIGIKSQEGAAQGSDVDAGGHFKFGRVLPGGYEFKLLKKPAGVVLRKVRCGGAEVTPDTPLRVGDRQKITGCELVVGREDSRTSTEYPSEPASSLVEQFKSTTVFWKQFEVAKKIVALHDKSVLQDLEPWLSKEDSHARGNAAFVFASLGDDRGFGVIKAILDDRSDRPRGQGIPGGGWSLQGQIAADRYYAAHLFGDLKDPRAIPILVPLLSDKEVNWIVPWSLGEIGDKSAIRPLIATLSDNSPDMRVLAIYALQQLDAREALPQLRALLDDNERIHFDGLGTVAEAATTAIAKLEEMPQ